jgi:DNA-binding MarR family transcriptional regulator
MEEFLGAKPNEIYTPSQIASALRVNPTDINVRLKKMVDRGRIVKVSPGKYRAGKTGVVKMPIAG